MKFAATFKFPDAMHYALKNMSEDDQEECKIFASKWIEYGEYVTVEFDTEAGTATVQEV